MKKRQALTKPMIELLCRHADKVPVQGSEKWPAFKNELEKMTSCKLTRKDYIILNCIALRHHGDAFKTGRMVRNPLPYSSKK